MAINVNMKLQKLVSNGKSSLTAVNDNPISVECRASTQTEEVSHVNAEHVSCRLILWRGRTPNSATKLAVSPYFSKFPSTIALPAGGHFFKTPYSTFRFYH
jgi:hypothetical protein